MLKTIFILAAGPLQIPVIITAKKMGLRTVALDGNAAAPGLRLADKYYVLNITDPAECLKVAIREKADGVIHICSEVAMEAMGLINECLGLKGLNLALVRRATNKVEMRKAFEFAGAPSPQAIEVMDWEGAVSAAHAIGGDIIIKPSRNSGSRGISRLSQGASARELLAAFLRAKNESRDPSVLVEQYVEGPEFSVEMLIWDGCAHTVAITDKMTSGAPNYVEIGHSQPTAFSEKDQKIIIEAAERGVQALGLDWCAAHAEVRLTETGAVLMEIGGRLGGDFITTELVPRSSGVDMVKGAICLALGEVPKIIARPNGRGAAIRYMQPCPGHIKAIFGVDEASKMPGIRIVDVSVKTGDIVPEMDSSLNRIGYVIAEGKDAAEAISRAEAAIRAIRIETV